MSHLHHHRFIAAVAVLLSVVGPALAEPLFTTTEQGRTFLYRAHPGEHPGVVAEMFGIPQQDVPSFLKANGITDPTRVGTGFTYRIPNLAAREQAERLEALERDNARLSRELADGKARAAALDRAATEAKATADQFEQRASSLARLERLWPWAKTIITLLILGAAGAAYMTFAALNRQGQAERYARTLAREAEEKRKAALAERQESARRILDLETRIRALEAQLGPRVVISGRGN